MRREKRESGSFRERFNYWFDNHMAKGSLGFIRFLIVTSVALAVLMAGLIILLRFNEEGEVASVFWDSIATVINAWMPAFSDGGPGYLALMSVTAIAGVLFTSVLIGIITSAIEEKIIELKKGNSLVLERDHIVVLGFSQGEYTLINQLILAAEGKPACIVVADSMDREEMEQLLSDNLDIPKNCRIVCRTVDITDPTSIEKCSIETCRTVIVSPAEDSLVIKAVLAVSVLMQEKNVSDIRVNAIISRNEYRFPPSLAEAHNISTLQTNDVLAKMIAHSCTQVGLSETFRELFNFEGSEFYLIELPEMNGRPFEEVAVRLNHAVPSGVCRGGEVRLNPPADYTLQAGDKVLVFSEESDSAVLEAAPEEGVFEGGAVKMVNSEDTTDTVIIGRSESLPIILRELPENVSHVFLAGQEITQRERGRLEAVAARRNLQLNYYEKDPHSEEVLLELAQMARHIVILSDHRKAEDEADMEVIFLLLNFRDLRARYKLDFNITVEMQKEHNQKLVGAGDYTDFLVASSMSALILAQLAENPQLIGAFREILSNAGNELYIKNAADAGLTGRHTIRDLRLRVLRSGYILFGYVDDEKRSVFNLPLEAEINLNPWNDIIVLGLK